MREEKSEGKGKEQKGESGKPREKEGKEHESGDVQKTEYKKQE